MKHRWTMRPLVVVILLTGSLLLTGCAGFFPNVPLEKMTAEQLKEVAKIKDAGITCVSLGTPWGRQSAIFVNVDKGVVTNGVVIVEPDCKASITSEPKPATKPTP